MFEQMSVENPKVTVLMPVYNSENYLREAIECILNQTFTDFEFLIMNDGSTDNSAQIIESYKDPRITPVQNEKNLGLIATLNKGLKLCKGEYIARIDSDDISPVDRLEKQVKFLNSHPEMGACSGHIRTFGARDGEIWNYPTECDLTKASLIFYPSMVHGNVLIRKESFIKAGFYFDPEYIHAEDYELWTRFAEHFDMYMFKDIFLYQRLHDTQVSSLYTEDQRLSSGKIRTNLIKKIGIDPTEEEIILHNQICNWDFERSREFIKKAENWMLKLINANKNSKYFPELAFSRAVGDRWLMICRVCVELGFWIWAKFWLSKLTKPVKIGWNFKKRFFQLCFKIG
jgi:glycosyltransferase involved in cell wall biosynthesis